MVWGREQWLSSGPVHQRQGRYSGDASDRTVESRMAMSTFADPWMVATTGVYAAQDWNLSGV